MVLRSLSPKGSTVGRCATGAIGRAFHLQAVGLEDGHAFPEDQGKEDRPSKVPSRWAKGQATWAKRTKGVNDSPANIGHDVGEGAAGSEVGMASSMQSTIAVEGVGGGDKDAIELSPGQGAGGDASKEGPKVRMLVHIRLNESDIHSAVYGSV